LKQGLALSPLLVKFDLEYAIWKIREKKESLELNGTNQLLVFIDFITLVGKTLTS
jgi:hypothetical protein